MIFYFACKILFLISEHLQGISYHCISEKVKSSDMKYEQHMTLFQTLFLKGEKKREDCSLEFYILVANEKNANIFDNKSVSWKSINTILIQYKYTSHKEFKDENIYMNVLWHDIISTMF